MNPVRNICTLIAPALMCLSMCLSAVAAEQQWIYPVKPGDTLIGVAETYLLTEHSWQELQSHNQVGNVRRLPTGSTLRIPVSWLKPLGMIARVISVKGDVTRQTADGQSGLAIAPDQLLLEGETLRTGPDSSALIEFNDGSRVFALADGVLKVEHLGMQGKGADVRLKLDEGRVESDVKKRTGKARFEIRTPAAQIGVRGTAFRVAASGVGARSEVTQGKVEAQSPRGSVQVPAGFGTIVKANKPPQKPQALLPAPALPSLGEPLTKLPIRIRWPEISGATAYRVQASPDAPGQTYLIDQTQPGVETRFADLADGAYVIKVRGIDRQGLEGFNAERNFTVAARPEPPLISAPTAERAVREDKPQFAWARSLAAQAYRLQIATDEKFSAPIAEAESIESTTFRPKQALTPGDYYWRIASRTAAGKQGPFSDAQKFTYKLPPPAAKPEPPEVDDKLVRFRWSAGEPGQTFRFQLARDAEFKTPIVDNTLTEPRVEVVNPGGGTYYLRVQAIDSDGFAGPFGSPQQVEVPKKNYWPLLFLVVPFLLF